MIPSVDFMPEGRACSALRRCAVSILAAALLGGPARAGEEVRALWVVRTTLNAPAAVEKMIAAARAGGFNTLLVQIRGRGDAYYANALEPRAAALASQPAFDPLASAIALGHAAGLRVHAWININLVSGIVELPSSRDHIVYRHPEWLMVPRGLAEELATMDPHRPEYLSRLVRHLRGQPSEIEGLYLSPATEPAASYSVAIVRDIVSRYPVDGIHFDYVRYPDDDFDYSRDALSAFRKSLRSDLDSAERQRYERRGAGPLAYTQAFPDRWREFRTDRMTALVARLSAAVRRARPSAIVSVAVVPDAGQAAAHRFQDWREWLRRDLVDAICPMAYTTDEGLFSEQIAAAHDLAGRHALWAGIGAYRLSAGQIVEHVQAARRLGAGGIVLFSYDSLAPPAHRPDYLTELGRAAFTTRF